MCQKVKINYFPVFRQWENSYETVKIIFQSPNGGYVDQKVVSISRVRHASIAVLFCSPMHFSEIHVTLNDQFKNIIEQSMLSQGFDIHVCAFICNRSKCGNVCSP